MANYTLPGIEEEDYTSLQLWKRKKAALKIYADIFARAYQNALSTEELFIVDTIDDLPEQSGVYFIYNKGELIYIGKARNIKTRIVNHTRYKIGYSIGCWLFPSEDIRRIEWTMIAILKPPYQRMYYLDLNFLNCFDITELTGIDYHKHKLPFIRNAVSE